MFKNLLARIVSVVSSLIVFVATVLLLYYFNIITLKTTIFIAEAFLLSSIVIFLLRLVFKKERHQKRSIEQSIMKKFGKTKAKRFSAFFAKIEARKFASAHVARIALLGYVAYYVTTRLDVAVFFLVLALIVGLARVQLKRHDFSDVLFGFVIGALSAYICIYILPFFWF